MKSVHEMTKAELLSEKKYVSARLITNQGALAYLEVINQLIEEFDN